MEPAAPPDRAWPWLAEPERLPRWMKGVEEHVVLDPPLRKGAGFRMRIREGRRSPEYAAT